jgi:hypothetical protein
MDLELEALVRPQAAYRDNIVQSCTLLGQIFQLVSFWGLVTQTAVQPLS